MVVTVYLILAVVSFFISLLLWYDAKWNFIDFIASIIISLFWLPFIIFCFFYWLFSYIKYYVKNRNKRSK